MTPLVLLGIAVFGGLGAIGRFTLDGAVSTRVASSFPWGTFAVNLSGALALGLLDGAGMSKHALLIAGTGFLGGYTTFSTWMLESERLGEEGRLRSGWVNLGASLVAGLAIAALGHAIGTRL